VGRLEVKAFLSAVADFSYRIKGYVPLSPDGELYLVDCVGEQVRIAEKPVGTSYPGITDKENVPEPSFVVIGQGAIPPIEDIQRTWKQFLDVDVEIS